MSTYREIVGKKIKKVSSDPSDGLDGQMWYNSTTGTLRGLAIVSAWSSAPNLINGQSEMAAGGTQTATVKAFGGTPNSLTCEEYNGSGWTSLPNGNTARRLLAATAQGTPSAFLAIGGYDTTYSDKVEEYDGSSWTANPTINTARYSFAGAGTATSALAFGGDVPGGPRSNASESFNGSSWTATPNLNTARNGIAGCGGSNTSGLAFGGDAGPPGIVTDTEEFDGSSWTTGGALPVAMSTAGSGIQTAALAAGGTPAPNNAKAFSYDGSSWTALSDLGTGRDTNRCSGAGNTANVAIGGWPLLKTTEEYNSSTNTITAGAWATATAYPASLEQVRAAGTQTSLVSAGGETAPGPMVTTANEYDGSSWTSTTALPAARGNGAAFGTQTAGVYATGFNTSNQTTVYTYNGSAWATSPGTVNNGRRGLSGSGTSTAGIIWGGYTTTGVANTEEWNGSAMSNEPTLNTARYNPGGFGTSTATLAVCGNTPPPNADTAVSEEYNGSSWTSGNNNVHALRMAAVGSGIQTDGIVFGGYDGSSTVAYTTGYDGTSWSTRPNMGTARNNHGSAQASPSINGIAIAGGPYTNAVEEFTAETSAANIGNFTTS